MDLSIYIPTYNRKERLLNQLNSLLSQSLSNEIEIFILNNHSDYDVAEAIRNKFGDEKARNIKIINNRSNLGLSLNIALPFYYCKTKWLWILSDDDQSRPDSLSIVKKDIKRYDGYTCIKYSLPNMSQHNDVEFSSLVDLIEYYERKDKDVGEFIFISNNIYNVEKLEPFIGNIIGYSYNAIAGILPYAYSLDAGNGKVFMRQDVIVDYLLPQKGKEWHNVDITTRLVTLIDYPFKSDGEVVKRLLYLLNSFHFSDYFNGLVQLNDRTKAQLFYSKTFPLLFQTGRINRVIYRVLFILYYYCGITNSVNFIRRIKRLLGVKF